MSPRFPVGNDFFQCQAPLPEEEKRYLIHIARTSCKELIKHAQLNDESVQWTPIGRNEGSAKPFRGSILTTNRGGHGGGDMDMHTLMYEGHSKREWTKKFHGNVMMGACVTQVAASIEEVASFFQRPTTREAREFANLYNEDCLDTSLLYTLVPPTSQNPWHNITVRWYAVKSPVALGKHRDLCFVETHDEFVDADGRRGWVLARESVSINACPALSALNLVRATTQRSGFVFLESELPGFLNVVQMTLVDFKGNLPRVVARLGTRKHLSEVLALNRFLHEKRLSQEPVLGDADLVPKRDRNACHICHKKFGLFMRHKVRCRKCGEVVCMSCQGLWTVDLAPSSNSSFYRVTGPTANGRKPKKNVRVCVNCSQDTRERSLGLNAHFLNTQLLRTADEDNVTEMMGRDSDISPINVLQSARSRALHEYVRRTSTSILLMTGEMSPNDAGAACMPPPPELPSPVTPSMDYTYQRTSKSTGDTQHVKESAWDLVSTDRLLSHSFAVEASAHSSAPIVPSSRSFFKKPATYRRESMPDMVMNKVESVLKYVPPSPAKKSYTPRKSGQTFEFHDNKLVGIRSSAPNYAPSEDLKSIERSLLADSRKNYQFPTFGIEDGSSRRNNISPPQPFASRSGRGKDNSSFISNATATPAHTSTSSGSIMSFLDDVELPESGGHSIDGLREKLQQTLNAPTQDENDLVALYKQMKAVRVPM
ncbi:hypothetical protein LEN26_015065 [Aphanomyces euteiches]|nr:hypothetical protein LEN26_015065 [Aphanomyces euteiches]KAH9129048.1 hypothetical protein AeMF1_000876 [Aphanomyces euteiches]